jgi:hypothetical protein
MNIIDLLMCDYDVNDSIWEILAQRRKIAGTSAHLFSSQSTRENGLGFEVSTAVTMRNPFVWDVRPYGSCKNRRFGGT